MIFIRKVLAILILLLLPLNGYATEKPLWVEVAGEARLGDFDTMKEVKERARHDARTKAIEQAVGVFIKSHTLVSNSQVAEDLIYAAVRGKISKEEILHANWDAEDRHLYRMKIKALVLPVYPEKGGGLSVKLSLSKTDLKEGDEVKIFYQVSEDAYIYIFSIAADGSVTLILPNAHTPDNFFRAGKAHQYPPEGDRIHLKAMFLPDHKGNVAEERIKLVATRKKEPLLPLGFQEGIFQVYDQTSTGMISDLVRRLNQVDISDWTEAGAVYRLKK